MKFLLCILAIAISFNAIALERPIMGKQLKVLELNVSVTNAGVDSGFDKFLVDSSKSATGTYALAHSKVPFALNSITFVTPIEASCTVKTVTEGKTYTTIVMAAADGTTEKDCAFNAKIMGSLSDVYYGL